MKKSTLRWVPAIAVPALVVAGALTVPSMANASVNLPHKSAAGIVALAQKSAGTSFSGTIQETANLGLPDISSSNLGGSSSGTANVLAELTGTHKANVFVSGSSSERIQTLDNLAEQDVIRTGKTIWAYDSKTNTATHVTLPDSTSSGQYQSQSAQAQTPTEIATKALAEIGKYTTVATSSNVIVAGQKAYEITLTPKDSKTLVGDVTLAVDASTGVPLKASITAKGQTNAALSVQFTTISYSKPSASTFAFTPPKGATVKTITVPSKSTSAPSRLKHPGVTTQGQPTAGPAHRYSGTASKPVVLGSGWSTVVGTTLTAKQLKSIESSSITNEVLTPVTGGKVLQTALVSIYLGDNGAVYVGAVSATDLEAAVAAQK
ncbi:MAG: hypothetical protein JWP75_2885 [Frondihabitans sp.]|nr:hypothetical protein [Frondihabitans sp.]